MHIAYRVRRIHRYLKRLHCKAFGCRLALKPCPYDHYNQCDPNECPTFIGHCVNCK